jgi:hypothetical protein
LISLEAYQFGMFEVSRDSLPSAAGRAKSTTTVGQLAVTGVGVEKVQFPPKQPKFGGYKMSRKLRKLFVAHPSAILFSRISRGGVFQQPQALALKPPFHGILSAKGIFTTVSA